MARIKNRPPVSVVRGEPLRQTVLDAAEALLRDGKADFSMRDLAARAGVSFATPFNQFGSKAAIMHALSARRIDEMTRRFSAAPSLSDAVGRVLLATAIGVEVMLEQPEVNRTVMGWIGTAASPSGRVLAHSSVLWALAIGAGDGLTRDRREEALRVLPSQLAFGFRGVLSFWTAGELPGEALASHAREVARGLLAGFMER
ncbi:TetR/AcrR family transcriptional regulator [Sphingomonas oryzagri]|uniref:TetR/AcrR family transcriptional regulator n=1 Tax=Sphingomonas oryzagri TaxID=3042314 RepID=A0ABT6N0P3_9SPHN|nr:TetR/AcrR family transcriptional regulator [Sphingomonas oryzagri]MDH7638343.1 TetR/AcrR family transcriptional regulator [Sphingomonas oryzagri]